MNNKIGNMFLTFGSGTAQAEYACACGFASREVEDFILHIRTHAPAIAKRGDDVIGMQDDRPIYASPTTGWR